MGEADEGVDESREKKRRGTVTQSSPFAKSAQGKQREEHRGHRGRQDKKRLKSSKLKVKESGKSTDDVPTGSGHTPVTEEG